MLLTVHLSSRRSQPRPRARRQSSLEAARFEIEHEQGRAPLSRRATREEMGQAAAVG